MGVLSGAEGRGCCLGICSLQFSEKVWCLLWPESCPSHFCTPLFFVARLHYLIPTSFAPSKIPLLNCQMRRCRSAASRQACSIGPNSQSWTPRKCSTQPTLPIVPYRNRSVPGPYPRPLPRPLARLKWVMTGGGCQGVGLHRMRFGMW
jgi:hypothetical protein